MMINQAPFSIVPWCNISLIARSTHHTAARWWFCPAEVLLCGFRTFNHPRRELLDRHSCVPVKSKS